MGVESRNFAATESEIRQPSGSSGTDDLATDLSRHTDRTHYSIPEDGREVDIPISSKKRRDKRDRDHSSTISRASHPSQTSLLIEYFEGGKGPSVNSRPSVRVKVTPSTARKIKDTNEHIKVTESKGGRKVSSTRRISLGPRATGDKQLTESADDKSLSSYTSAAEESSLSHRRPPVEIEVMGRDQGSDVSTASPSREDRFYQQNASEISSMPPDSMLEGKPGSLTPRRNRSRSISRDAVVATNDTLKAPSRRRSRSLSKERLAHKAMEKLAGRPREVSSGKRKNSSQTRSRSVSNEQLETIKSSRRRSSKTHKDDELVSGAESSLLTTSQMSPRRQSGDQYSFRSGTSKSSINANPRLLETVENAIRRLIMPELENLKQEQKLQQTHQKFERDHRDSVASGSSMSRGELTRKLSKHASAPDVTAKPKAVLNRDEHNVGTILSGDSIKGRKEHRGDRKLDSPKSRKVEREISEETVIRDGEIVSRKRSQDGRHLKDASAGAIAGGILTAAALNHHDMKHHDSKSSLDRKERRRRRSKSHSRSASIAESTEDVFNKHDVPPMPMRSEIHDSEITRDSILSERTEATSSPAASIRMAEIRHVSRGSPREVLSPGSQTPTRNPVGLHKGLGTQHSNLSRGDVNEQSPCSDRNFRDEEHRSKAEETGLLGAATGGGALAAHQYSNQRDGQREYGYRQESRGLSPIQSVSSRQESEAGQDYFRHKSSSASLTSLKQKQRQKSSSSIKSLSPAASVNFIRSNRPKGINLEPGEDILDQHRLRDSEIAEGDRDPTVDEWFQREHEKNDRYRDSVEDSNYRDSTVDYKHMTNYTDDSLDAPYLDRVTAAQQLQGAGAGQNPDYRSTPVAVESAVASLHDSSILSARPKHGDKSYTGSHEGSGLDASADREIIGNKLGSREHLRSIYDNKPEGKDVSYEYTLDNRSAKDSPRQSIARSLDDRSEHIAMGATGLPVADDPMPEIGHGLNSESEISTNPSIIQGPMGGTQTENRDHWPYQATPPQHTGEFVSRSKDSSVHEGLRAAAAGFLGTAGLASQKRARQDSSIKPRELSMKDEYQPRMEDEYETGVNHDFGPNRDSYMTGQGIPSPPKDEGYISGAPRGPSSPEVSFKNAKSFNDGGIEDLVGEDDPFVGKSHTRNLSTNSGLAHGMGSPLYDSATGGGIDRIQSKDIVALMDHLTVRDAQRNARDTEILVTLVRSAAEMRNSFEEMKRFIAEQDDILVDAGNRQHDRTIQKIILGGPRPQPLGTPRFPKGSSADGDIEDNSNKKRNVFRRALKGLSGHNQNDISKIEEMLVHLLGEVEGLKATQDIRPSGGGTQENSLKSYNNLRAAGPDGYEPEGHAGTGSTGQSGYFSNPPSRGPSAMRGVDTRRASQNRVSTVLEGDEELEAHEQDVLNHQFENNEQLITPTKEHPRAGSVPLGTPPQRQLPTGTQSNEHTPKTSTDKSRQHKSKSSSSSFFPKISRWSKTTTSSAGDNVRNGGRRERPFSEASRSGDLQNYETNDHYNPLGEDRLPTNDVAEVESPVQENRPPSPLIPSQVSEDPKYQAHRDSQNLQHPQPRPGPTHRYQHHLESQAHNYDGSRSPISPTSDAFGSDATLARFIPGAGLRYSGGAGNLSPISDVDYSEASAAQQAAAPPRPPKVKDDGPLIPAGPSRPPKLATKDNRPTFASPLSNEHLQPEQRYSNGSGYDPVKDSPRSASGTTPQRKPTGPRPLAPSGSYNPDKDGLVRNRYRGSPNHVVSSAEDLTF